MYKSVFHYMQQCFKENDVLNSTLEQAKREIGRKLDMFSLCKICKTACFSFKMLILYVLHSEVFYIDLCTKMILK